MKGNRVVTFVLYLSLATTLSCGSRELPIAGQVLVNGAPMESGTLHFAPVESGVGKPVGGSVEQGVLEIPQGHGLMPGRYRVSATAFKKTGKTVNDYQRGKVEEIVQLQLQNSPQEIELSHDSAGNLAIEFTTAARK